MAENVWTRPVIVPVPVSVQGVANPVMSLNSNAGVMWKFTLTPPADFWSNSADQTVWPDIQVPGECAMQGFGIDYDTEYPYKVLVNIPQDFAEKMIILRFDGVHSYARVWVNGTYVRDHQGGFTSWDCDITGLVTPGQPAWITVSIKDLGENDPSRVSTYVKHKAGGILRDVKLIALSPDYVTRFHVETDFDDSYTDATLRVTAAMAFNSAAAGILNLALIDPDGNPVPLNPDIISLSRAAVETTVNIPICAPQKWDSEHPRLYTLDACMTVGDDIVETVGRKVGFRKVQCIGSELYINGQKVRLRGVNRHDTYPISGRSITDALCEQDVLLLMDANVNIVRTSHYPPVEKFLDYCDKYGMYVEEETAVCWAGADRSKDPDFTAPMMNQFTEMIERDRSHPCVIMWSLGNESEWGDNFEKEKDYARLEEPGRPVLFNFDLPQQPTTVKCPPDAYDIRSHHYVQLYDNEMAFGSKPVFHDEICPPVHIYTSILKRDMNARSSWGQIIKAFWHRMFDLDGCVGGAIWAGIDDTIFLPQSILDDGSSTMGWGVWGLIDGWRREKPEHWEVKKAYSPVEIAEQPLINPGNGKPLSIPVHNRFNHTNLNEIDIDWCTGADKGIMGGPDIQPRENGILTIPARKWQTGDIINLKFWGNGRIIDEYNLSIGKVQKTFPGVAGPAPSIVQDTGSIMVSGITEAGKNFGMVFNKTTGQITSGTYSGSTIIVGGPYLNTAPYELSPWSCSSISSSTLGSRAVVNISGSYGAVGVNFIVQIDRNGLITTTYTVTDPPPVQPLNESWEDINTGFYEFGVAYELSSSIDRLTWDRKGLWSQYPDNHIGRLVGTAFKERSRGGVEIYRAKPAWDWCQDMKDFYLFGAGDAGVRGTNDFRSTKENIWFASAVMSGSDSRLRAESCGSHAVRAEIIPESGRVKFIINNIWFYSDYMSCTINIEASSNGYTNTVNMRFATDDNCITAYFDTADGITIDENDPSILYKGLWTEYADLYHYGGTARCTRSNSTAEFIFLGTSITWKGPKGSDFGDGDVYIDNIFDTTVNCHNTDGIIYSQVLYNKSGLQYGWHTIRIAGKSNGWVGIDALEYRD